MPRPPKKTKEKIEVSDQVTTEDLFSNLTAIMYLITEQQAMIGKLLQELIKVGALGNDAMIRITENKITNENLAALHEDLYKKYVGYVTAAQQIFDKGKKK